MSLPHGILQVFIIILYENVFQNPELFPTQVSLSSEHSTLDPSLFRVEPIKVCKYLQILRTIRYISPRFNNSHLKFKFQRLLKVFLLAPKPETLWGSLYIYNYTYLS
jgi:hypothetical protein